MATCSAIKARFTANYISDAMRQDWEANRAELMAFWRSGKHAIDNLASPTSACCPGYWCAVPLIACPWAAKEFKRAA